MNGPDRAQLEAFLLEAGLAAPGERQVWSLLPGGVSAEVWKVEAGGRTFCVKRALARLRVKADWRAPVARIRHERAWLDFAREVIEGSAPRPLAFDEDRLVLAMEWLEPQSHPLWKARLLAGNVDPAFAGKVGASLSRLHAASAARPKLAEAFATDAAFFALRLDAYLLEAGRRNPQAKRRLARLVRTTAATRLALVHGDVSPKNILIGPSGPVFLDAETAWWGDPAFDLAFCLNHLLLKHLAVPAVSAALAASFRELARAHLSGVDWEPPDALEARAAALLPGLLLARVDGKSPVEYLDPDQQALVRAIALELLDKTPDRLEAVLAAFGEGLDRKR
ncbi:MAG: phosphotransferase family protein [Caulobacteraceae bacterium]